jgi:ABC-type phosphate transport system permease subunit
VIANKSPSDIGESNFIFSPKEDSSTSNTGIIAGVIVGVAVLIGATAAVIYKFCYHKNLDKSMVSQASIQHVGVGMKAIVDTEVVAGENPMYASNEVTIVGSEAHVDH